MTIELLYTSGCPHVDAARTLLRRCLAELGQSQAILERDGDFPSPSIVVSGADVMGRRDLAGAMCRLDLPTRERVLAALARRAHPDPAPPRSDGRPSTSAGDDPA